MLFWNKRVAPVAARMMTWEVTTAFDGTLTETELHKRFDEDFGADCVGKSANHEEKCAEHRVFFWPLVSFNASDGRKHRYLVVCANETLAEYRKKFERCLPKQIALYKIADKILRGKDDDLEDCLVTAFGEGDCAETHCSTDCDGNMLFAALWNGVLYVLVFVEGRLCHWSQECGYGSTFDEMCYRRIERFKGFLKNDELFSKSASFANVFACCDNAEQMEDLFDESARDMFWRGFDLDVDKSMKSGKTRKWTLSVLLGIVILLFVRNWLLPVWNLQNVEALKDVPATELNEPPRDVLERLAWAKGHRDMMFHEVFRHEKNAPSLCDSLNATLLGIAGGRAALVKLDDGVKTLKLGDSLMAYRVKSIGKNDVVLRCGRKEVHYEMGAR